MAIRITNNVDVNIETIALYLSNGLSNMPNTIGSSLIDKFKANQYRLKLAPSLMITEVQNLIDSYNARSNILPLQTFIAKSSEFKQTDFKNYRQTYAKSETLTLKHTYDDNDGTLDYDTNRPDLYVRGVRVDIEVPCQLVVVADNTRDLDMVCQYLTELIYLKTTFKSNVIIQNPAELTRTYILQDYSYCQLIDYEKSNFEYVEQENKSLYVKKFNFTMREAYFNLEESSIVKNWKIIIKEEKNNTVVSTIYHPFLKQEDGTPLLQEDGTPLKG